MVGDTSVDTFFFFRLLPGLHARVSMPVAYTYSNLVAFLPVRRSLGQRQVSLPAHVLVQCGLRLSNFVQKNRRCDTQLRSRGKTLWRIFATRTRNQIGAVRLHNRPVRTFARCTPTQNMSLTQVHATSNNFHDSKAARIRCIPALSVKAQCILEPTAFYCRCAMEGSGVHPKQGKLGYAPYVLLCVGV